MGELAGDWDALIGLQSVAALSGVDCLPFNLEESTTAGVDAEAAEAVVDLVADFLRLFRFFFLPLVLATELVLLFELTLPMVWESKTKEFKNAIVYIQIDRFVHSILFKGNLEACSPQTLLTH